MSVTNSLRHDVLNMANAWHTLCLLNTPLIAAMVPGLGGKGAGVYIEWFISACSLTIHSVMD